MASTPQSYECEGCGEVFNGLPEDAFQEGWDTPEWFQSHITCPNCPISKTLWWRLVILKEEPKPEELTLLQHYNNLHESNQPESWKKES